MKLFYQAKPARNWFEGVPEAAPPSRLDPVQLTAWSIFGLLLLALVFVMYAAQVILIPAVAAAVTAVIFSPVMRWLERRGIGSSLSALLIIGTFVFGIAGATALLVPTVRNMGAELPGMASRIETKLADVRISVGALRETLGKLGKATEVDDASSAPKVQVAGPPAPGSGVAEILFQFGLFAVLTFFLLSARVDYRRRFILSRGSQAERLLAARIIRDMGKRVSSYLFTVTIINTVLGILTGVALAAVGMPFAFALFLAFAIALFNFLPFIGPIIVIVATAVISLATFDGWTMSLLPPAIVLLLHLIELQFVSPWLIGRRLDISPLAVFAGIAFLGWLWGAVGAMVAVPILILLYTFGQRIPLLSPLASMIGPTDSDLQEEEETEVTEAKAEAVAEAVAKIGTDSGVDAGAVEAGAQAGAEAGAAAGAEAGAEVGAQVGAKAGAEAGAAAAKEAPKPEPAVAEASATVVLTPSLTTPNR